MKESVFDVEFVIRVALVIIYFSAIVISGSR